MQINLKTLAGIAGGDVATEVAVERLREIAGAAFADALSAIDVQTLRSDPQRFRAAARAVEATVAALHDGSR